MSVKNNSKQILIETASRLFRIRGYYGVGLNDIIDESGIPKGSLYHYFPKGKEQLAIEAINHTKEIVVSEIQELFDQIEDPITAIQTHVYQLSKFFSGDNNTGFPIGTIAGESYSTSEPIRNACQLAFNEWQNMFIDKFLSSGYSEKQALDLSIAITALLEGGILLSLTSKSGKPLEVISNQIPLFLRKE